MKKLPALSWLALTLLLAGCGSSPAASPSPSATSSEPIRISLGVSDETELMANIYAQALEAEGYTVELVDTGASRQDYLDAMQTQDADTQTEGAGGVDLTPDYSGELLLHLTDDGAYSPSYIEQQRAAASASASSSASVSASASLSASASPSPSPTPTNLNASALSESDITSSINRLLPTDLSLLNATEAQNRKTLVITAATAEKYGIKTMNDLAQSCDKLTLGVPKDYASRSYGVAALDKNYGCTPAKIIYEDNPTTLADELADNTVQIISMDSANAEIAENAFTVLEDPKNNFIPQQLVPVVNTQTLPETAREKINKISARFTTADLKELNQLGSGSDAISKKDLAQFWLKQTTE